MFGSSKEKRFWQWFQKNEDRIFEFEADQEQVFTELSKRLRQVHQDLAFEFGPVRENGKRCFVVSADGFLRAFPAVDTLINTAPDLPRWTWIKFRQRGGTHVEFTFDEITINTEQTYFTMVPVGDQADVTMYFVDFNQAKRVSYEQAAFLLLDHLLGEFDVVTRVGRVAVSPEISTSASSERLPLCELPAKFDSHIATQRKSYH